jgi:hypothetical protein
MLGISLEQGWVCRTRVADTTTPGLLRIVDLIIIITNYLQNTICTKLAWIASLQQPHHTKP